LSSIFLLIAASACSFSSKTQKDLFKKAGQQQFDAIIVPGVPFENNQWDRIMKARVYWSKYLYDKGIAKNIVFSGSAVYSPYYEGKIMALYAQALGLPKEHVFAEIKAQHSTENIYYGYKLARKQGFSSIALASDPFQTKMLRRYTRLKVDSAIVVIPFVMDTLKMMEPGMIDPPIDYQQAYKPGFISLKKREGFWKRWRGTRGKNADVNAYD